MDWDTVSDFLKHNLILGTIIFAVAGCAHKPVSVTFQSLEKMPLGTTSESDIRMTCGEPAQIASPPKMAEHFWIYRNPKTNEQKAIFGFTREGLLSSKEWKVSDGDFEQKLTNALARFVIAKFEKQDAPWENPHAAPDESIYIDQAKGITIVFRNTRKEVSSITWSDPKLRDVARETPTQYIKCQDEIGLISLCDDKR